MKLRQVAVAFLLALSWTCASAAPARAQDLAELVQTLSDHGVPTTVEGLTRFLEKGWQATHAQSPLPVNPPEKTTLLTESWIVLTLRYEEVRRGGAAQQTALSGLALAYAEGRLPPAIDEMLDRDVGTLGPAPRKAKRQQLAHLLRYNGMVALGFYGMADEATRAAVRKVYEEEKDPVARVIYARTLALLGDRDALGDLANAVKPADRAASVAAANALQVLLGRSFGLRPNQAIGPRRQAAADLLAWWEGVDPATVPLEREAAIMRQLHPVEDAAPSDDPTGQTPVRELLRRSADQTDVANKHGSRSAWRTLNAMDHRALQEAIAPILSNADEDLDIRMEAIRWYVQGQTKSEARSRLKKLRKDPNPEIASMAEAFLK